MQNCTKCGSENVRFKQGISKKNNKAWAGYKCSDCDNMDFIKMQEQMDNNFSSPRGTEKSPTKSSTPKSNGSDSYKTMVLSYCKDIVVAEIAKGNVEHPFKRVADGYKTLLAAYAFPFGKEGEV